MSTIIAITLKQTLGFFLFVLPFILLFIFSAYLKEIKAFLIAIGILLAMGILYYIAIQLIVNPE
jgi:hypothetical protein